MPPTFVSGRAPLVPLHVFGRRPLGIWATLSICFAKFGAYATTLTTRDEPEPMIGGGTQTALAYYYMEKKGYPLEKYDPDQGVACPEKYGPDQGVACCAHNLMMEKEKGSKTKKQTKRACSDRYEEEDELAWLMQSPPDEAAWITSLKVLREKLEEMTKAHRAVVVDALLRRLDWHSTNTRDGYFLGHMGGRTAMLTSLLVAAQEDTVLVQEFPVPPEVHGMWQEMAHFLEQHPGSHRSLGRGIGRDPPCIMLHCHEGPSITPDGSPRHESPAEPPMQTDTNEAQGSVKRMRVRVEVSTGSCDVPQLAGVVEIPIQRSTGSLQIGFTLQGEDDAGECSTVPASPPSDHGGAVLSPPAPDGFGEFGISLLDYWRLKEDWEAGKMTLGEMATIHREGPRSELVSGWSPAPAPHCWSTEGKLRVHIEMDHGHQRRPRLPETRIQASSEWLRVMGLRRPGQENTEPANAMTRTSQQNARIMLRQQSEQGLVQMYRALMRVMGMLFIEATRILIDEHDERRRGGEMVDVTLDEEEDDESIYMQAHIHTSLQGTWAAQLQKLVEQVDSEGPRQKGVARALLRRIEQSLFLQSARGAQLQAALVAVVGSKAEEADTCDTHENDGDEVERWWSILKKHMDLMRDDTQARGSRDSLTEVPGLGGEVIYPTQVDIETMAADQEEAREEQRMRELQQAERERDEAVQQERDRQLFEAHEAQRFRDWEQWTVLHEPVEHKRRRLVLTGHYSRPPQVVQGEEVERATIPVPMDLRHFHAVLHFDYEPTGDVELAAQSHGMAGARGLPAEPPPEQTQSHNGMEVGGPTFLRTQQAWRAGHITDAGVSEIFGNEWLLFFRLEEADTQTKRSHGQGNAEPSRAALGEEADMERPSGPAQDDDPGQHGEAGHMAGGLAGSMTMEGEGVTHDWTAYRLKEGEFVITLDDSNPEERGGRGAPCADARAAAPLSPPMGV
ncbi:unnamed protein product, partial [Symbiodinium microadriaticum]